MRSGDRVGIEYESSALTVEARRWRIADPAGLTWREWDGEFVVRNERTGNTHLLDAHSGSVLACLIAADAGASVAEISLRLRDPSDSTDPTPAIELVLIEFERFGLAVREPT